MLDNATIDGRALEVRLGADKPARMAGASALCVIVSGIFGDKLTSASVWRGMWKSVVVVVVVRRRAAEVEATRDKP